MKEDNKGGRGIFWNYDLFNLEISDKEFRMLCAISNLCAETGECYAGNKHFSDKFGITPETCTRNIKELESKGAISIRYTGNGTNNKKRFITLTNGRKSVEPIDENVNVNNTSINNNIIDKSIIKEKISKDEREQTKQDIIEITNCFSIITPKDRKTFSISNLRKNKDLLLIMSNKQLTFTQAISSIRKLAHKLDEKNAMLASNFRRSPLLDSPSGFLNNFQKVISNYNASIGKTNYTTPTISEEEQRKRQLDLINNF